MHVLVAKYGNDDDNNHNDRLYVAPRTALSMRLKQNNYIAI